MSVDSGLPPLDLMTVSAAADSVIQRGADRTWTLADPDWTVIRPELLTEADRSAVRFLTYIEDHIPGYLTWALRSFPVDGSELDMTTVALHREYFRFFVSWAYDEERHARVLVRYQEVAEMADPRELRLELAGEGRKHFDLPYAEPLSAFTYTMLQEKATQLFYQQFRSVVREPLLRDLLLRLARDEARHFGFYAHLVEEYLRRDPAAAAPHLKEVLRTFRMPLADTLPRYRRWSEEVAEVAGYDHTQAYLALERLVEQYVNGRAGGLSDLYGLLQAARSMP
jgi:acyl-[acyl-carrier-protein] desaturase